MKKNADLMTKNIVVAPLAILCCFLWGSAFPTIKLGYAEFAISGVGSTILFAGLRFTMAGLLVLLFGSLLQKKFLRPGRKSFRRIGALSFAQTTIQYLFFYMGLSNCSGVKSSLISSMSVFFSIFVACFIFKQEKFSLKKGLGCLIGFIGVLLINMDGLNFGFSITGEGFLLISSFSSAVSTSLIKEFSKHDDPVMLCAYQFILGGVFLIIAGLMGGGRIEQVTVKGIFLLIYLALISSCAYTLWGILLKYNKPSSIAVFGFLNPAFGVILSFLWLNEDVNAVMLILSLSLVCIGVVINQLPESRKTD